MQIPHRLVEFILLGPQDDRRLLQDSPILGDVWLAYADAPGERLDLLITPYKENASGKVASSLARSLRGGKTKAKTRKTGDADIAYLQGIVAANLTFQELLRHVVPMTAWWHEERIARHIQEYLKNSGKTPETFNSILLSYRAWPKSIDDGRTPRTRSPKREQICTRSTQHAGSSPGWARSSRRSSRSIEASSSPRMVARRRERSTGPSPTPSVAWPIITCRWLRS